MAAAKSTKKTKTTSKTKVKSKSATAKTRTTSTKPTAKTKSTTKTKATAKSITSKKKAPAKTVKKSSTTKTTKGAKSVDFLADIIKQATKAQKASQTQAKGLLKQLNSLDKECAQLTKKLGTAKGKSAQTLEGKITKLKTQITATRTALLTCENNTDKLASVVEFVTQLSTRPAPAAYMPTSTASRPAPSKPTLVKSAPAKQSKKAAPPVADFDDEEEDFMDDEDESLNLEDDVEEMDFIFGEDDDLQEDEMGR